MQPVPPTGTRRRVLSSWQGENPAQALNPLLLNAETSSYQGLLFLSEDKAQSFGTGNRYFLSIP